MGVKVYGSATSPFVRKVRILLIEKNIAHEWIQDDIWSAETKVAQFNPLVKVPTLQLDDGRVLYDSRLISEALDSLYSELPMMPLGGDARIAMRLIEVLGDGIMEAAVNCFLEKRFHPSDQHSQVWLERQTQKIERGCVALEKQLVQSETEFLHGEFSVADASVGAALGYVCLRMPEHPWPQQHPQLLQYINRLDERLSFALTRPS